MTKAILPLALLAIAATGCSQQAQDNAAQAADSIAADANATAAKAIKDTDAATDAALGAAEARIDKTGDVIGNKVDRATEKAGKGLKDLGNEIEQ